MLRMGRIVRPPRPLQGLQEQRGFALQTVALLNEELLLFTEEPQRVIFIHWLHVTAAFFCHPLFVLFLFLFFFNIFLGALYTLRQRGDGDPCSVRAVWKHFAFVQTGHQVQRGTFSALFFLFKF